MKYRFAALSACTAVLLSAGAAMAQPANGTCSTALPAPWVFPGAGGTILQSAAELAGWSYSGAACAGSSGGVVYYNFTPDVAGPWRLSTCATAPTFDTVLSIHTGCPANATNYATGAAASSCNDTGAGCTGDASTFDTTALTPGVTYVIRLARWNSTTVPTGGVRVDVSNLGVPTACCNPTTGVCTVAATATACPSGSTALPSANGVCDPNPCPQPPANDLCASATVIPATALPFNASVTGSLALALPTTALTPAVCATSSRDVFYSFTPVDSGAYTITTCTSVTGSLDTVVSVHSACPADGSTLIAGLCSDDNCTGGIGPSTVAAAPLTGGTTYIIRVARWGTGGAGGPFRLDISTGAFGACCDVAAGTCLLQSETACASPLVFQGDATTCAPNPCVGTCCNPATGACTLTGSTACASPNVFTSGPGAVCTPNPCPPPPAPANDTCAAAQVVTLGSPAATGTTAGGITDFDEIQSCVDGTVNGVWFAFTPAVDATYQIDTRGGTLDTVLTVLDGCNGFELACDDDAPGIFAGASEVQVALVASQSVRILVTNYSEFVTSGPFPLNISVATFGACCNPATGACTLTTTGAAGCTSGFSYIDGVTSCTVNPCPQPPAPANDTCAAAQVVTLGSPAATGTNVGAVTDFDEIQSCATSSRGVWYAFTATSAGTYRIDTAGSAIDTVLTVVDGCNGLELACNDDSVDATSRVNVSLAAGQSVRILVGVFGTTSLGGAITLNISLAPAGPANDECTAAVVLTAGTPVSGTVTNANGALIASCSFTDVDVWYSFTPATGGAYSVQATPDSATDAAQGLAVYDSCPPIVDGDIACAGQPAPGGVNSLLFTANAGTTYYIRAGAFIDDVGNFSIVVNSAVVGACCDAVSGACTISTTGAAGCASGTTYLDGFTSCTPSNPCPQPPPPANDECSGAIALQLNVAVTGSNVQATGDGFEGPAGTCYFTSGTTFAKAIWFSFTAPANDSYGFTACGSSFDTVLSIFDGDCNAVGTELACDDDTCDGIDPAGSANASIIAPTALTQGQTYLVRLAAWGTAPAGGAYSITATGTPVVSNVVCCRGVTCAVIAAADCTAPAGVGIRTVTGNTCAGQAAINAGCCYADFNKSNVKDVADIFAYLSAWFANSPFADVGGDGTGTRDVADIFAFLSAWFAGCT